VDPLWTHLLLSTQRSFAAYGASHWAVLALLAAGVVVLALLGGRYRGTPAVVPLGRVFAVASGVSTCSCYGRRCS
jgi:hypothetical protein